MELMKTPVTVLEEFCKKQKFLLPDYEEIPLHPNLKSFRYIVGACGYMADGEGKSKKEAKHAACAQLIEYLRKTDRYKEHVATVLIAPAQLPSKPTFNAVSTLLELCVQKMWPVAQFNDNLPSNGPPHDPEFTAICRVSMKETTGKASTKKGARQVAAAEMLNILKRLDENANEEPIPMIQYDDPEKIWRQYREWKRSDVKIVRRLLSDRHNTFMQLSNDVRKACYKIFSDPNVESYSNRDLVGKICKTLGLKYKVKTIPNHRYQHKTFILEGDFDVVLVGNGDKLYGRVIDYFKTMLNFQNIAI